MKSGDYIFLKVIDKGKGIKKEDYNQIFKPFFTTKKSGTGLGLAISKIIIENHNGYLGFESKLDVGTTFYFLIPGNPSHVTKKIEASEKKLNGKRYSALGIILDDNRNILNVLENLLLSLGIETIGVSESTSFINTLENMKKKKESPDFIILDLTMPGDQGAKELILKVREISPESYIIISSGYSDDFVIQNYSDFGFDNFLRKPFDKQELIKVLDDWYEKKRKEKKPY
ncbi:MAG: response regulator [Candidatus Lokiarchaeota archaeon]|nr:response regulator [Candidatus Harpocratesius repetitus]